ncbi:hypothetical protein Acr_21g0002570 [Actinidia rufa]|uniref:Retrotransposon gag domain-containing protein n=1 Tax=Actinidia rufa TaxID=165716 RepID=A0A7J0GG24_9ERIC|nr:hypothetical protein Acr_21g0002570 [Actinidia rufa]
MIELNEDVLRIRAATYQFSGRALSWWDVVKTTNNVAMMTWADFERVFLDNHFPQVIRNGKRRARCFEQGRRPGLRGKVVSFELNTFGEGNSLRGRGKSTRSDSNSPPILSRNSLNSRDLPLRRPHQDFLSIALATDWTKSAVQIAAVGVQAPYTCHFSTTAIILSFESQYSSWSTPTGIWGTAPIVRRHRRRTRAFSDHKYLPSFQFMSYSFDKYWCIMLIHSIGIGIRIGIRGRLVRFYALGRYSS